MIITILHSKNYSPNEISFLYPLVRYKKYFELSGINIKFTSQIEAVESDVIICSSKRFSHLWGSKGPDFIKKILERMRRNTNAIIWYDLSDSTGTTQFMVLDVVDHYFKNQILKNKKNYNQYYYGSRVYSDYIHRNFNINDNDSGPGHLNYQVDISLLEKVCCGWNSGLSYFGKYRDIQSYLFSKSHLTTVFFKNHWRSPDIKRSIPVSCRIGANYSRDTIAESRRIIMRKLTDLIPTKKINRNTYYNEIRNSIAAVSPFGLGEISLRDFETTLNGAAMIKQDMSHLETWPNLWIKNETYLDFKWDLSDIREKVEFAISRPDMLGEYAYNAQSIYRQILDSKYSAEIFCERFKKLISVERLT